jgi:hypothetical protein
LQPPRCPPSTPSTEIWTEVGCAAARASICQSCTGASWPDCLLTTYCTNIATTVSGLLQDQFHSESKEFATIPNSFSQSLRCSCHYPLDLACNYCRFQLPIAPLSHPRSARYPQPLSWPEDPSQITEPSSRTSPSSSTPQ